MKEVEIVATVKITKILKGCDDTDIATKEDIKNNLKDEIEKVIDCDNAVVDLVQVFFREGEDELHETNI